MTAAKRKRPTLKTQYRKIAAQVGYDEPLDFPRVVTVREAWGIVNGILTGTDDRDDACDALAALLARALTGEAAFLETVRTRVRNLESEGKRTRTHISAKMREAIIRADRELKRAGVNVKKDRCEQLVTRFSIPADTIRKITPQLARGRPKKLRDKP